MYCSDQFKHPAKVRYKLRNHTELVTHKSRKKKKTQHCHLRHFPRSRARCLLPLARRRAATTTTRIAAADGRCLAFPADALRRTVTDVRTPFGRRHFITPACSPLLAPLDAPARLADAAIKPSAAPTTPVHRPIIPAVCYLPHTSHTQVSLHPSVKCYYIRQPSCSQPTDHMLMDSDASSLEI